MAHNSRIRADITAWATGTVVSDAEFNALDAAQFAAINGDDGGSWAPSAFIGIGGSGLRMLSGSHQLNGALSCTSGSSITVASGAAVTLASGSTFTANAELTLNHGASVNSASTLSIGGSSTLLVNGVVQLDDAGRVLRRIVSGSNIGATVSAELADLFFLTDDNDASGATLSATCRAGDEFEIVAGKYLTLDFTLTLNGTVLVPIEDDVATTIKFRGTTTSGKYRRAKFTAIDTNVWAMTDWVRNV